MIKKVFLTNFFYRDLEKLYLKLFVRNRIKFEESFLLEAPIHYSCSSRKQLKVENYSDKTPNQDQWSLDNNQANYNEKLIIKTINKDPR